MRNTYRGVLLRTAAIMCSALSVSGWTVMDSGRVSAAEVQGPKVDWAMSLFGNPRPVHTAISVLADEVKAKTDGNFTIKLGWGSVLAQPAENIDGLKIGAFEAALIATNFHPGKAPTLTLPSLPFLPLSNLKVQKRVLTDFYKLPAVEADAKRWNMIVFSPVINPTYELMGKGAPPKTIADLKGRRVRATGESGDALKLVGAVITNFATPELYGAMERGVTDAIALSLENFKVMKIDELSKWYSTNLGLGMTVGVYGANLDAWGKLPASYRQLIADAGEKGLTRQIAVLDDAIKSAEEGYRARGLMPVAFAAKDMEEFRKIAGRPIWDAYVKELESKGYPGRDLLDWILKAAETAQKTAS